MADETKEAGEPLPADDEIVLAEDGAEAADEVVEDPAAKVTELEARLATEHDRLLRTAADLDNLRKRMRRDLEDHRARGRVEVLHELLPAIDSLDLALSATKPDGQAESILRGVEIVRRQFLGAMEKFGVKPIESVGAAFDPNLHEALTQVEHDTVPPGHVVQDLRKGYMLGDRLLRAAMVIVAKPKAATPEAAPAPQEEIPAPQEGDAADGEEPHA
ncbi:MAG: nucleotide exchange factor GrpE [Deltaproteobacteria bacterium]|nr:nucleotide exchange factor GrpE [Deltaproteobacteria bacterium]